MLQNTTLFYIIVCPAVLSRGGMEKRWNSMTSEVLRGGPGPVVSRCWRVFAIGHLQMWACSQLSPLLWQVFSHPNAKTRLPTHKNKSPQHYLTVAPSLQAKFSLIGIGLKKLSFSSVSENNQCGQTFYQRWHRLHGLVAQAKYDLPKRTLLQEYTGGMMHHSD